MSELFTSMLWPLVACVVLVGIHVYLGMHVLQRQVIFVDLALAQFAALGTVVGLAYGHEIFALFLRLGFAVSEESALLKNALSFGFATLGAIFFALVRPRVSRIGQEAVIGISYAVAMSAMLLLSTKLPHGADELRDLFSGNILWVLPSKIGWSALLYVLVGVFHFVFRDKFFSISINPDAAKASGINVGLWDFLFYFTFAGVVTSSVSIAGVLLVFAFLVIPASASFLLCKTLGTRLLVGWVLGTLASIAGVIVSYLQDLPTGPVIVVLLALILAIVGIAAPKETSRS